MSRLGLVIALLVAAAAALPAQHLALHLPKEEIDALVPAARMHFAEAKRLGDRMQYLQAVAHLNEAAEICPDSIALQRLTADAADERIERQPRAEALVLTQTAMQAHMRILENPLATAQDRERSREALDRLETEVEELRAPRAENPHRLERTIQSVEQQRREIQEATQSAQMTMDQAINQANAPSRPQPPDHQVGSSVRPSTSAPSALTDLERNTRPQLPPTQP